MKFQGLNESPINNLKSESKIKINMKSLKYCFILLAAFLVTSDLAAQCLSGDCVNGRGKFQYPSGAIYQGEFVDGEIHGVGKLVYSDGREYIGEWVHRYQEGKGKMTMNDGRVFKGYWKKGEFYGEDLTGEPIAINEQAIEEVVPEVQTGCIVGDCKLGQGTMLFADGSKYEGNFANDKINGYGTYYYANGAKYTGEWKDGYYNGEGTKYNGPKDVRIGLWQNGEYIGTKEDQSKKGCISGDCENGDGTYVYSDGSKYIGGFKDSEANGEGICYYSTGNKYTGGWQANTFHGQGTMFFANGEVTGGMWDKGNYLGAAPPTAKELEALASNTKVTFDPTMKVYAIIVGVAKYNHMPVLNYTDDDAYRMYAHLLSPQGGALGREQISILIDEDATKKKILQNMKETFAKADSNDMVLLYFSGHGLKGAFIPFDFDGFNNKLFHEEVKTVFNSSDAKFKICIADACHSGSLNGLAARGGTTTSASSVIANYYKAFDEVQSGTALLLSSKAEETSLESSGLRQGIFSHFLMRGLEGEADADANEVVTIEELYVYIHKNVRAYTGNWQTPILEGNFDKRMPVGVVRN